MKKVFLSMLTLICSLSLMATQTAYVQIDLVGTSYPAFSTTSLYLTEDTERSAAYESGYDSKDASELNNNYSVLLYAFVGAEKCSSVATNDLRGLQIGFTTNNVDTEYKLQFSDFDGNSFYLFDKVLNKLILINSTTPDYAFTAASGQVEVNDRFVINTVGIIGTESAWWETEYNAILTIAGETATGSITFPAGKVGEWYNFKVVKGDQWLSNKADFTTNHSQIVNAYESDNMYFEITLAGEYTFTWNFDDNTLTIGFPTPVPTCTTVRTGLQVDRYYTICLDKAVTTANGASFWNMSNRGVDVAYLEEAELPLVAGRPYIFQAEATELCVEYSGDAVAAGAYGALVGTFAAMDQAALNAAATAAVSDIYLLYDNKLWLANGQSGNNLPANRAYIVYDELVYATPTPAPGRRVRAIPMQGKTTTGVESINAAETPVKTVIDGKMYILRGEHMFDATGRMVK